MVDARAIRRAVLLSIWRSAQTIASSVTWYQRHAALVPADAVDFTTPAPEEVIDTVLASQEQEAPSPTNSTEAAEGNGAAGSGT